MRRPPTLALVLIAVAIGILTILVAEPATAASPVGSTFADYAPTVVLAAASVLMMAIGAVSMVRRRRGSPRERR